ncbi:MAG TPA: RNA polymerase sigma factor [Gemmatimonadales bacterium]|nr:RNA polymerase sigma factor [Gemmatimonadales bacterium]
MDERQLIDGVLSGDPQAERLFYDRHVDRVWRLAYRFAGDGDLAQDIVQETFVRAFGKLETFRGESTLSTWVTAVATSTALSTLRKVKRFRGHVALEDAEQLPQPGRRSEPDLKRRMDEAIAALPEGYRTVFLMHDVEGYTHEEIGAALGVQAGTSKAQLFRARGRLREALADFAGEWIA